MLINKLNMYLYVLYKYDYINMYLHLILNNVCIYVYCNVYK